MPPSPPAHLSYRLLAGVMAALCFAIGAFFVAAFLDRAVFQIFARPPFDTNFWGYYIVGFAGAALFAWGGCLVAAVRDPVRAAGVGTASTAALIVASMLRLLAAYSGEYRVVDVQLRAEGGVLALAALAFLWLKPPRGRRP